MGLFSQWVQDCRIPGSAAISVTPGRGVFSWTFVPPSVHWDGAGSVARCYGPKEARESDFQRELFQAAEKQSGLVSRT